MKSTRNFPNIVTKIMNLLDKEGHKCYSFDLSKKELQWCNKDICQVVINIDRNQTEKINNERMNFAEKLVKKGHTCVCYMETFPVQIRWCNNEPCSKSNNKK